MDHQQLAELFKEIADELMNDIVELGPWLEHPGVSTINTMVQRINCIKHLSDDLARLK